MRMKLVALVLCIFSVVNVHAQTVQDGLALIHAERNKEAGELFTKLATGTPSADNQYYLGYYYVITKQLDEAQKAFEKGMQLDEKSVSQPSRSWNSCTWKGRSRKSERAF